MHAHIRRSKHVRSLRGDLRSTRIVDDHGAASTHHPWALEPDCIPILPRARARPYSPSTSAAMSAAACFASENSIEVLSS